MFNNELENEAFAYSLIEDLKLIKEILKSQELNSDKLDSDFEAIAVAIEILGRYFNFSEVKKNGEKST